MKQIHAREDAKNPRSMTIYEYQAAKEARAANLLNARQKLTK